MVEDVTDITLTELVQIVVVYLVAEGNHALQVITHELLRVRPFAAGPRRAVDVGPEVRELPGEASCLECEFVKHPSTPHRGVRAQHAIAWHIPTRLGLTNSKPQQCRRT